MGRDNITTKEVKMEVSRRDFLKMAGAGVSGIVIFHAVGSKRGLAASPEAFPLKKRIGEKTTICPYDATGCGFIVAAEGDQVINIEGDPDHPINRGGACAKGASLSQLHTVDGEINPRRLTKVLYRSPGGSEWETKSWNWAIEKIASNIKETRDTNWTSKDNAGYVVNRTDGIASVGGAALDNEECYLLVKALRALGLVYVEHQARI
jgi:formate dehydrogenase major subunit